LEVSRERAKLAWAITHPLRRRILRALADSGESRSPTWLATALGLPLGTTVYHLTILPKFGAVELADEQIARGPVERFYLPRVEDDPPVETSFGETRGIEDEGTESDTA
jgi:DNA-binding transcriptional ArsR family regulator